MALIQPLIGSNLVTGAADFDTTLIGNSAWYDGSADYMNSPSFSAQADPTCFIFATWIQLLDFSIGSFGQYLWSAERPSNYASIRISNTNKLIAYSNPGQFESSMIFRDIGWYHIICSYKGPDDTIRMFVNGNEITVTKSNSNTLASNLEPVHASHTHRIGAYFSGATGGTLATAKSYMAQTVFLDGFSFQDGDVTISDFLDTFTFGTNGSQFIPKKNSDLATLAGTAGANSYVIDYADSSNLGNDISSKNNNFTLVSMGSANQSVHTPSKVYATLNPLVAANAAFDLASGATEAISAVNNGNINASMVLPSTGVFYWEVERNEANDGGGTFSWYAGIMEADGNPDAIMFLSAVAYSYYSFNGTFYEEGSAVATGNSWNADGDKVAFEFDADNGTLKYYKNNSLERTKTGLTHSGGYVPFFARTGGSTSSTLTVKFKQSEWAYTPPTSGALELVSTNLTTPTHQGIDHFNAVLYTGNGTAIGSGGKAVTGTGFQPDWVWIKDRDADRSHSLYDVVRGTTKQIEADNTAAETTEAEGLTTFGTDGFTVGNLAQVNTSSEDYVAWQWLGSNSTTTNTNGSLNTTVTVATADHFSIVGWTMSDPAGAKTLGHGLSAAPELIIVKNRTDAGTNWPVYSEIAGNTKYQYLSTTAAAATFNMWQNTSPTSTVFSVSSNNEASGSANDQMIAYCFRSVPGVCKVGKFVGNFSHDGPYISLGFKPSFVMIKEVTTSGSWYIYDFRRSPFNSTNANYFLADSHGAENVGAANEIDILSDGFKNRGQNNGTNQSGSTFLYLAMAEIGGNGKLPPVYGR